MKIITAANIKISSIATKRPYLLNDNQSDDIPTNYTLLARRQLTMQPENYILL